jgi:hypothetical protein
VEDLERSGRFPAATADLEGSDAHPVLLRQNTAALQARRPHSSMTATSRCVLSARDGSRDAGCVPPRRIDGLPNVAGARSHCGVE